MLEGQGDTQTKGFTLPRAKGCGQWSRLQLGRADKTFQKDGLSTFTSK